MSASERGISKIGEPNARVEVLMLYSSRLSPKISASKFPKFHYPCYSIDLVYFSKIGKSFRFENFGYSVTSATGGEIHMFLAKNYLRLYETFSRVFSLTTNLSKANSLKLCFLITLVTTFHSFSATKRKTRHCS